MILEIAGGIITVVILLWLGALLSSFVREIAIGGHRARRMGVRLVSWPDARLAQLCGGGALEGHRFHRAMVPTRMVGES